MKTRLDSIKLFFKLQELPKEPGGFVDVYLDSAGEVTKIELEGKVRAYDLITIADAVNEAHAKLWPPTSKKP